MIANDDDAEGDVLTLTGVDATGVAGGVTFDPAGTITFDTNEAYTALGVGDVAV